MTMLSLLLLLASCSTRKRYGPISDDQANVWAKQLEAAIDEGDDMAISAAINGDVFVDRVFDSDEMEALGVVSRLKAKMSARSSIEQGLGNVGAELVDALAYGGSYTFIRHFEQEGKKKVLFRLENVQGLNYHIFTLVEAEGEVKAEDVYVLVLGSDLSEVLRNSLLGLGLFEDSKVDARLIEDAGRMQEIRRLINEQDPDSAMVIFEQLHPKLQDSRIGMFTHIQLSMLRDTEEFIESVERMRERYPENASVDLLMIDYYFLKEEYAKSLTALNRLDRAIGGDVYLNLHRAGLAQAQEDWDRSANLLQEMLDQGMERNEELDFAMLSSLLGQGRYDESIVLIEEMKEIYGLGEWDFNYFSFPDFMISQEYDQWKDSQGNDDS